MATQIVTLPRNAESVIVQTAPDVSVAAVLPPGPQEVEVSDCGGLRFTFDRPRLAAQYLLLNDRGESGFRLFHLRGADPLTGIMGGPYAAGNVHPSGNICWGGVRPPSGLRDFMPAFFGSPFNQDLTREGRPGRDIDTYAIQRQAADDWQAEAVRLRALWAEPPEPQASDDWFLQPGARAAHGALQESYRTARRIYGDTLRVHAAAEGLEPWALECRVVGIGMDPLEPQHPLVPVLNDMRRAMNATHASQQAIDRMAYAVSAARSVAQEYGEWIAHDYPDPIGSDADRLTPARRSRLRRVVREQYPSLRSPEYSDAFLAWAESLVIYFTTVNRNEARLRAAQDTYISQRVAFHTAARRGSTADLTERLRAWFAGGFAVGARDTAVGLTLGGSRYIRLEGAVPAAFVSNDAAVRAMVPGLVGRWVAGFACPGPRPRTWAVAVPQAGKEPVRFVYDPDTNTCAQS